MVLIFFYETPEGLAEATSAAQKLRAAGKKVRLSNASYFDKNQLERVEAVVALGCPHVVEAYEARNDAIQAAEDRGDVRMFAGINKVHVVTSSGGLIAEVEGDPDTDVEGDELGSMTREMLMEYAESMIGLKLPANMRKSDMVAAIREGFANQSATHEPE